MFSDCERINKINFIYYNTSYIINMKHMLYDCKNLNNVDLSSFDTKNVTNMNSMFFECPVSLYQSNKSKFKNFKKEELI